MALAWASKFFLVGLFSHLAFCLSYRTEVGEDGGVRFTNVAPVDAARSAGHVARALPDTPTKPRQVDGEHYMDTVNAANTVRHLDEVESGPLPPKDVADKELPLTEGQPQAASRETPPKAEQPKGCWIFHHMNKSGGTTVKFMLEPYLTRSNMRVDLYDSGQWRGGGASHHLPRCRGWAASKTFRVCSVNA